MIEISHLVKSFKNKTVLRGLNLRIGQGERVALIGHNGSGKTTMVRCLLGLHAYEGSIRVTGLDPAKERLAILSEVGFVPQSAPSLRLTVGEFTHFLSSLCAVDVATVMATAARLHLDLERIWKAPFRGLSGGMKQKLLIAAALARRPKILILDEPTANLDPAARGAFFDELRGLPPETVLLISSHRVDELAGLVTRLVELDAGVLARDEAVKVMGVDHGERLQCRIALHEDYPSLIAGLKEWGLTLESDGAWQGTIHSLDRFRFIADLARWSGILREVSLADAPKTNVLKTEA